MALTKVTTSGLADDSITSAKVANGVISAADVADGTLTVAKLTSTLDLSSNTVTLKDPDIVLENSRKANFDTKK